MSNNQNHCATEICRNGNCIGCQNGEVWCGDPRCAPYCPNCYPPNGYNIAVNAMFAIIFIALIVLLIIVWVVWGPPLLEEHSDHSRAGIIYPTGDDVCCAM